MLRFYDFFDEQWKHGEDLFTRWFYVYSVKSKNGKVMT